MTQPSIGPDTVAKMLVRAASHKVPHAFNIRESLFAKVLAAVFTGDTGSGGAIGLVPAAPAGSAAAGEVLGAGGTFVPTLLNQAQTATAAGTTTLVALSPGQQIFTGTTTQTVKLPVTSTLKLGQEFKITNSSTGVVTVQSSGANTIRALNPGDAVTVTVISLTGTTAASWLASSATARHGVVAALSSVTVASNAISVTLPANTLVAGDIVRVTAGSLTDGGSTAVTITITAAGATVASSGSDSNTAAHNWCGTVEMYYDGTNLITSSSVITDGAATVASTGASNAQAATATCAFTVAGSTHATPSALSVVVIRP